MTTSLQKQQAPTNQPRRSSTGAVAAPKATRTEISRGNWQSKIADFLCISPARDDLAVERANVRTMQKLIKKHIEYVLLELTSRTAKRCVHEIRGLLNSRNRAVYYRLLCGYYPSKRVGLAPRERRNCVTIREQKALKSDLEHSFAPVPGKKPIMEESSEDGYSWSDSPPPPGSEECPSDWDPYAPSSDEADYYARMGF